VTTAKPIPTLASGFSAGGIGASIGEGAVIDPQFGTTDVLIVLPVSSVKARYLQHFAEGMPPRAA
jgi:putative hemolysin